MTEWTPKQKKALLDGVGSSGWRTLRRRTGGRTKKAIAERIRREYGGGGITRGTYTLAEMMRETGYSRTQLQRAAKTLGQRWNRTGKGSTHHFLVTGEQLEELVFWLRHDFWSKKLGLYGCVNCGTSTAPHHRFGCCLVCYQRMRRIALRHGLTFTAKGLLEFLESRPSSMEMERIRYTLRQGRAPTRAQLEVLCGS